MTTKTKSPSLRSITPTPLARRIVEKHEKGRRMPVHGEAGGRSVAKISPVRSLRLPRVRHG